MKAMKTKMKILTKDMLLQNMALKAGEHFKIGRYTMVYRAYDGGKFDTILPVKIWKQYYSDDIESAM